MSTDSGRCFPACLACFRLRVLHTYIIRSQQTTHIYSWNTLSLRHTHTHITHVVLGGKWVVGRIHMRCEWAGKCNGKFVRAPVCVFVCVYVMWVLWWSLSSSSSVWRWSVLDKMGICVCRYALNCLPGMCLIICKWKQRPRRKSLTKTD